MNVIYKEDDSTKTVELTIKGKITQNDFNTVAQKISAFMKRHKKIKLIEKIDIFDGLTPSAFFNSLAFNFQNWTKISHCAVVSDLPFMGSLAKVSNAVSPIEIKSFKNTKSDLGKARTWISNA